MPNSLVNRRVVLAQTMPNGLIADWYNNLTVKPSPQLLKALNELSAGLNADGIWTELDLFHPIGGLETDEQRLRPLITTSTTKTFTAVNSPTLSTGGVTGNGSSSYINTNWNPSLHTVKFTQNNASFGCYNRTAGTDNGVDMGCTDGVGFNKLYIKWTDNMAYIKVNNNAVNSALNPDPLSFASCTRPLSNSESLYMRGVLVFSDASVATALPNRSFFLCAYNSGGVALEFSSRTQALVYTGSGNISQLTFYNRIQTYMTARGISV